MKISALLFIVTAVFVIAQIDSPIEPPYPAPSPDTTELPSVLLWIVFGGGAGIAARWLIDKLRQPAWSGDTVYTLSILIIVLLAGVGYYLLVVLGYEPPPAGSQQWIEEVFSVCLSAVLAAQINHRFLK